MVDPQSFQDLETFNVQADYIPDISNEKLAESLTLHKGYLLRL